MLKELLAEFSFASDTDLAAALAALLTAAARPSLRHAPMFHVRAHMVGSGKSYLCELITAFATPQRGTPTTFPADDEECRKLLLAELLRAPAVIEFDNLTSDLLAHKSLCTALTSEHITGRILGVSKTATVRTRALFLSSGNNVGPVQDMTRRCITIHLAPQCEVPAAREFQRPELVGRCCVSAAATSLRLTIARAWLVAGRPKTQCRSLAGFGEWSDLCRQPLLWLGQADPTESVFQAMAEDPDRETLGRLLTTWQSVFGKTPAMVRDAVERASPFHDDMSSCARCFMTSPPSAARSTAVGWDGGFGGTPAASWTASALSAPAVTVRRRPGGWNRFRRFRRFRACRSPKVSAASQKAAALTRVPVAGRDRLCQLGKEIAAPGRSAKARAHRQPRRRCRAHRTGTRNAPGRRQTQPCTDRRAWTQPHGRVRMSAGQRDRFAFIPSLGPVERSYGRIHLPTHSVDLESR